MAERLELAQSDGGEEEAEVAESGQALILAEVLDDGVALTDGSGAAALNSTTIVGSDSRLDDLLGDPGAATVAVA